MLKCSITGNNRRSKIRRQISVSSTEPRVEVTVEAAVKVLQLPGAMLTLRKHANRRVASATLVNIANMLISCNYVKS